MLTYFRDNRFYARTHSGDNNRARMLMFRVRGYFRVVWRTIVTEDDACIRFLVMVTIAQPVERFSADMERLAYFQKRIIEKTKANTQIASFCG